LNGWKYLFGNRDLRCRPEVVQIVAMSEELDVLKQVARRLEKAGVSYMITGSIAANFYTVPRMTRDIDIVVELFEPDIGRFIPLFENDYYLDPQTVREAVKNKGVFNLIHEHYIIKIDFVVRKDTPYRRREFSRRRKVAVDDQDLYVVSPEDLILSKLDWAKDSRSEVQLNDVRNLLKSVKRLNRSYLARWAKALRIESLYREVSK
jgi:hypothetical protein